MIRDRHNKKEVVEKTKEIRDPSVAPDDVADLIYEPQKKNKFLAKKSFSLVTQRDTLS